MRRIGLFLLAIFAIAAFGSMDSYAQYVSTRHVRSVVRNGTAQIVGRLPESQLMTLNVVLPLSNQAGLDEFLSELYDPNSSSYHRYLTPAQFTARFGPSAADYNAAVSYVKADGFQVIGGSRDGMNIVIRGPVSAVEQAFHVTMRTYKHPSENRNFYSPDREPTTSLSFQLWHISGMDNYSIPHSMLIKKSDYAAAHGLSVNQVVPYATTGSGPSASFLGSDMRAAYYGSGSLTGAGENLGLLEYYGTDLADLTTYFKNVGQTNNVPITLLSTDGTSTSCLYSGRGKCDDTEQTLDMTQAIGMAPGLSSLVMYIGSTDTAMIAAMTTHTPLPTTIGCSWGWTPDDPSTLDPYFEKMAAQGQNFFAASGDSSTWSSKNEAWPADDANVISVGGTDLITASAAGLWKSETAWSDSGGGISPDKIAIPSWQQLAGVINSSNKGSTTYRNGPDVSANANFTFYTCADQTTCLANEYGGTSFATPMWAAYIALVNQQLQANGQTTIGFLDPTLYQQNVGSGYAADFHDITSGTSGSYSAVTGFDLVTGWGSPNTGLIAALTGSTSQNPAFTLAASPASLSVAAGSSGTSTITATPSNGFNSSVTLTASGMPSGVTIGLATNPIANGSGSSVATFTVASTTAAGTYSITITGTGNGVTSTTAVSLTVSNSASGFAVSASPASLTVDRNSSGASTITVTASGGFDSAISLSASGQGSGETVSFSPASITGSGTSTMTVKASRSASTGTDTITITGKSGSTTETTTVSVDIVRSRGRG
ncbi:MAG: protease pro-enzyme activation domain-containing protein [Acidobacteriaceae bacterium]